MRPALCTHIPSKQIALCLTRRRVPLPSVRVQAIANHNESHSARSGGDDRTVGFCKAHGISYSAYSPLEGLSVRPPELSSHRSFGSCPQKLAALPMKAGSKDGDEQLYLDV